MKHLAFTLVELLVVIAIIAILAAILFPVMGSMTAASKRTACSSNMRQIGAALVAYAGENNMDLPATTHTAKLEKAWIFTLAKYLGDTDKVRICPADPNGAERLKAGGTSYVLNSYVFVPEYGPFGNVIREPMNNLLRIQMPARTILAFVVSDGQPPGATSDHTHSGRWKNWNAVLADIAPDRHRGGSANADHTSGDSNYLYADGHVETIDAKVVKEKIDAGINIAVPPTPETVSQ